MADSHIEMSANHDERPFLCGVVEGFYGRPWTPEQRKDLFSKQEKWKMNCYLYAPKDDYKHRAYWRELYTVEEAEHMQALINEANNHNTVFYYAISPGLDITYSSQKEIDILKRKLDQVKRLGCNAFALLFDDVDPEMTAADKEVYQSFAQAQVSVANEIYSYLGQPKFMFCPTQYCSIRAVPTVQTSEYLNTLGSKLASDIDIMWTGPKVISKILTEEHIREVALVLQRPPVIWDNLHANDYDQARLFLGPYCGRPASLKPLLRGVVTNPNCEYGPNFIAIHTLAQWARSSSEENMSDNPELKDDAVSADIRLETEDDDSCSIFCSLPANVYHPQRALQIALEEWIAEFSNCTLSALPIPIAKPQVMTPIPIVPSVNTCMSLTSTTTAPPTLPPTLVESVAQVAEGIQDPAISNLIPGGTVVMNSLASENKVDTVLPEQIPEVSPNGELSAEPMDCNTPCSNSNTDSTEEQMVVEAPVDSAVTSSAGNSGECDPKRVPPLAIEDLQLLADLFYLPFEHGKKGINMMTEFNWLKSNSHLAIEHNKKNPDGIKSPEVQEWFDKATKFSEMAGAVKQLSQRLLNVSNRQLLYELYPYMWDMSGVVSLLNSYVKWLALGQVSPLVSNYVHGNYTWFSKGWKEAFMSGYQEPWLFRGGLTADLQRLIPVDASNDLFLYRAPERVTSTVYVIRPYLDTDKEALYRLVLSTCEDGANGSDMYLQHPNLPGDTLVGPFLRCGEAERVVMVVEDGNGVLVGYCCANPNAKAHTVHKAEHRVELRNQYPKVLREEGLLLTACEQLLATLWEAPQMFPLSSTSHPPPTPPTAMSQGTTPPPPSSSTPPLEQDDILLNAPTSSKDVSPSSSRASPSPAPIAEPALTPSPTPSPDLNTPTSDPNVQARAAVAKPPPNLLGDALPYYPATLWLAMLPRVLDESVPKRLMTCVLACLRAKGGFGGHVCVSKFDKRTLELYAKLGFNQIGSVGDSVYVARAF